MDLGLCIEMALTELPFENRLARAAALGFRHVEMWLTDSSYHGTPPQLAALAARAGVRITNTTIGTPDGQVGGGLTDPARRPEWLARARQTLEFTAAAGIGGTIVCTGNVVAGAAPAAQRQSVLDGLRATADLAERAGVTLLLEPLNDRYDHAGYWLTGSDAAAALCREVGSARLRLLFDCYHMQLMEGDLLGHIRRNLDVIGHFHAAGVPGRHELFLGEVDYAQVVAAVRASGYGGVFGLEYLPSLPVEESLRRTLEYLRA